MGAFNLLDQLTFYGSYHHNKWNKLIHLFFVPTIWWSAAVWGCYSGPLVPFQFGSSGFLSANFVLNLTFFLYLGYAIYYLTLDFFAGLTFDIVLFGLVLSANAFYKYFGPEKAWLYALAIHVLSWYMQIHPGHMMLEGRKPALTDAFFQSLVLAPLFVWFEVLFFVGLKKELYEKLERRIVDEIARYKKGSSGGGSNGSSAGARTSATNSNTPSQRKRRE